MVHTTSFVIGLDSRETCSGTFIFCTSGLMCLRFLRYCVPHASSTVYDLVVLLTALILAGLQIFFIRFELVLLAFRTTQAVVSSFCRIG